VVYTLWILRKSFDKEKKTREYITNKQTPEELIMRLIKNAHTLCTTTQQSLNKGTYVFLSLVDAKTNLMQQSKECHGRRLKSRLLIVNKQLAIDIKCISR
jgi:hypothetical protein